MCHLSILVMSSPVDKTIWNIYVTDDNILRARLHKSVVSTMCVVHVHITDVIAMWVSLGSHKTVLPFRGVVFSNVFLVSLSQHSLLGLRPLAWACLLDAWW